jgi:hypothetical protein
MHWSQTALTWLSLTSALVLLVAPALVWASFARAMDVWTVGVNNTRQGWNKFETVLTPANVPKLRKVREFMVDHGVFHVWLIRAGLEKPDEYVGFDPSRGTA